MTNVASMKVQVSADTRRFDMAMKNVRSQIRASREGVSSAAAAAGLGSMGGVVGGAMGVAALSGPLMAMTAAITGVMAAIRESQRRREEADTTLRGGVISGRMSAAQAMQLERFGAAAMADPTQQVSASIVQSLLSRFTDRSNQEEMIRRGATFGDLSQVRGAGDLTSQFMAIRDLSAGARGGKISGALGGDLGVLFDSMRDMTDAQIRAAMQPVGTDTLSAAAQRRQQARFGALGTVDSGMGEMMFGPGVPTAPFSSVPVAELVQLQRQSLTALEQIAKNVGPQ